MSGNGGFIPNIWPWKREHVASKWSKKNIAVLPVAKPYFFDMYNRSSSHTSLHVAKPYCFDIFVENGRKNPSNSHTCGSRRSKPQWETKRSRSFDQKNAIVVFQVDEMLNFWGWITLFPPWLMVLDEPDKHTRWCLPSSKVALIPWKPVRYFDHKP